MQWASQLGAWWQEDYSLDLSSTALVAGIDDDGDDDGDDEDDDSTVESDICNAMYHSASRVVFVNFYFRAVNM